MNEEMIERARNLAISWHTSQVDKAGRPYIEHLQHVEQAVKNSQAKVVAYLHDILEDTECTIAELRDRGFEEEVIDAVVSITHRSDESYDEFIKRVAQNKLATMVKIADMKHNSDLSRLPQISQKDRDRQAKYVRCIDYLESL